MYAYWVTITVENNALDTSIYKGHLKMSCVVRIVQSVWWIVLQTKPDHNITAKYIFVYIEGTALRHFSDPTSQTVF